MSRMFLSSKLGLSKSRFTILLATFLLLGSAASLSATTITIGAGPNAIVNGTNLVNTLNGIVGSSAANPFVIKLDAGIFDIGANTLVLKDFVDIEGSGRDVTRVTKSLSLAFVHETIRVPAAINAEVRDLTVANTAGAEARGVVIQSDEFLLTQVNIEVGPSNDVVASNSTGVLTQNSSPRVDRVFARLTAGATSTATGIKIEEGGTVVTDSLVVIVNPGSANFGIACKGGMPTIQGAVTVLAAANTNIGILLTGCNSEVRNSVQSSSGGELAVGIQIDSGNFAEITNNAANASGAERAFGWSVSDTKAFTSHSVYRGTSVAGGRGFGLFNSNGGTQANASTFDGNSAGARLDTNSSTALFGATQLAGPATISNAGGSATCVASYRGNYTPTFANCL